jgi:hypothetical protein
VAPSGKTLTAATLIIRTDNRPAAGSTDRYTIRFTTASWSETRMTWNSRAAVNGSTLGTLAGATALKTTYTASLAPAALAGRGGKATTLVIASSSSSKDLLKFRSRSSDSVWARPILRLTYR